MDRRRKLLTIATNADPGKKTAEVAQGQIEKLGFKLNFRIVPQDTLYTKFCGVPKAKVAICPNVGWFKDFTDPQSMLDADVQRQEHPRSRATSTGRSSTTRRSTRR